MGQVAGRRRIVVVGGGPAGLAAALSLTDPTLHPTWQDDYDVTVLQMGWRVGGKGATGRRGDVVADPASSTGWRLDGDARIEEHGIHLFGNMYTNALRMLDTCLQELAGPPIADVLRSSNYIQLADFYDRRWHLTPQYLANNDLLPWGPQDYPDPATLVGEVLRLVHDLVDEILGITPDDGSTATTGMAHKHALAALRDHHGAHRRLPHHGHHADALAALDAARTWAKDRFEQEHAAGSGVAARIRSVWCQIELYVTVARGTIADEIFVRGIDVVDGENFVDWCRRHGMCETALWSGPVQLPAQMCFQYPSGDTTGSPLFSASGFLWFTLRQVLACGQATYWFTRGTGDTVIAPYYQAAVARGVDVRFFHKVREVHYDAATGAIDRIDVDIQATTVDDRPYQPLATLPGGTLGWPDHPIYGQLVQGPELAAEGIDLESWWSPWQPVATEALHLGADFTEVVLATPLPCLPYLAPDLVAHAAWAPAVEGLGGIETFAAQLWTNRTTEELGFPKLSATDRVCGGAAVNPLGYADMSDVLAAENWAPLGDDAPKGLIYVCGPVPHPTPWPPFDQHDTPDLEAMRSKATLIQWLRTATSVLPNAGTPPAAPDALDFDALWCPPGDTSTGEARVDQQYWRANIDPNERYVPSPPGQASLRPKAWDSGASNLALASDWIFTGINIGSFEGAVMSGLLAAHALTGLPVLDDIAGYDFARPTRETG